MAPEFAGKRIVILGLARQGAALARFLAQAGARVVVSDAQPAEKLAEARAALAGLPLEYVLGGHPASLLDGADLLCLSGGVAADLPLARLARQRGIPLSNDSQIFLECVPPGVTVIGITGSAGKTTTTTLVGRMCAAEGEVGGAAPLIPGPSPRRGEGGPEIVARGINHVSSPGSGAGGPESPTPVANNLPSPLRGDIAPVGRGPGVRGGPLPPSPPGDHPTIGGGPAPSPTTFVGGNIGNPLIAELPHMQPGDRAVMELSSFQLEIMTRSPHVAAVLNLTPNHLDRHGTMAAYAAAKSRILRHQPPDGIAVLGWDDPGARALAALAPGQLAYFSAAQPVEAGAYLSGDELRLRWGGVEQVVAERADIQLRGHHNLLNVLAACAISAAAGVPPQALRAGLAGFTGVPHRLELVRERGGVRWYNDSIATAPERVAAAIRSFTEPLVLLLGGRDKQLPWEELAALAAQRARAVVVFGEAAPLIQRALAAAGLPADRLARVADLAEAVAAAAGRAQPGDAVLLSPGGTSFDQFRDFAERGERFRELVNALN